MGVGVGQSKVVVGGVVVQAHGSPTGIITYFASSPQSHQPSPLAMAAQVFWGSAACSQVTVVTEAAGDTEVVEGMLRFSGFPDQVERKSIQP